MKTHLLLEPKKLKHGFKALLAFSFWFFFFVNSIAIRGDLVLLTWLINFKIQKVAHVRQAPPDGQTLGVIIFGLFWFL
jgi:hypothetical protein